LVFDRLALAVRACINVQRMVRSGQKIVNSVLGISFDNRT